MMDKKSANGFSGKSSESGGQRKQLPYSVETPYGFHLDLDFLKYVDDIEKGNTIKRVHIQRKNRGPKYSTLPRNFSLPGHGARPAAKDTWSNTSTLGSKPKARVTEVQQLFNFRASTDNASSSSSSSQSTPAGQSNVQGSSYVSSPKTVEQVHIQASQQDQQASLSLNVRPHLFRATSMPVNVPHRKASDSTDDQSSQSQNGSTEKLFHPVDSTDRRGSIPQDRASLHQQITTALKRVRELEEQVRTIPELKAQICSLREEREQLLQRIQTQAQIKSQPETAPIENPQPESLASANRPSATEPQEAPTISQDTMTDSHTKIPEIESTADKLAQQLEGPPTYTVLERGPVLGIVSIPVILIEKAESPTDSEESDRALEEPEHETDVSEKLSEQGLEEQEEKPETSLKDKEPDQIVEVPLTEKKEDISEGILSQDEKEKPETTDQPVDERETSIIHEQDVLTIHELQEKVKILEERLRQVSCDLETTNSLLRAQVEENMQKDVTILELNEKVKEPIAVSVEQELEILPKTELIPQVIVTCDASVNTDSKHVLEKAVLTDIDSIKEPDQMCCSTQTNIVETREMEVLAQVMTAEKVVGVEIVTCDQAVETDAYENMEEEGKEVQAPDERESVDRDDADKEKMSESMITDSDVAEEYVIVEKTEGDLVEAVPKDNAQVMSVSGETELVENVVVAIETIKSDLSTVDQPQQDQKQRQGQDIQPQTQRPAETSASPAAIGHVVTRIQGLLNEQWASLGSGSQEPKSEGTQKQPASKISTLQSHLRGSLSALSAFYSPVQKGGAAKQSGLKSIMKKNDCPDKQGTGGAKKNLKFVGVNGGYETTSSEESSGEENEDEREKEKEEEKEEVDSLETEEQGEEESGVAQEEEKEAATAGEQAEESEAGWFQGSEEPQDPQASVDPQEEQPSSELVDKNFMSACRYLKDRMAEVSGPNKEMRQVLMVIYQEWFRVSSQKDSQADTVTLYLREVGNHTPTLLRYIVNLADGNGNMALHYSVSHSNFQVVKLLLDTGLCEVDHQNKAGYTAIMLAALTAAEGPEDMEVAQHLLSLGNINARAGQSGQTALMLAVSHGRTAMVQVLLECKADINIQDQDGSTALICACEHGHAEIAKLLLDTPECDTSLTDKNGHTALSVAIKFSHSELVDLLKAHTEEAGTSHTTSLL